MSTNQTNVPTRSLADGIEIPLLGLGVWQVPDGPECVNAVRWALGEQSMRNVRCRQAVDLIFAVASSGGAPQSPARAPMGLAEVMLTFDNSAGWLPIDYQDVSIGRRVYRSGENEYLLNGAKVRLRDITDLPARVGVGSGNHLVIGQGLVDTTLSARPEERRALQLPQQFPPVVHITGAYTGHLLVSDVQHERLVGGGVGRCVQRPVPERGIT